MFTCCLRFERLARHLVNSLITSGGICCLAGFVVPRRIRRRGGRDQFDESAAGRRSGSATLAINFWTNSAGAAGQLGEFRGRRCGRTPTVPQPLSTITRTRRPTRRTGTKRYPLQPKNKSAARHIRRNPRRRCRPGSIFLGRPAMVLGFRRGALRPYRGVPRNGAAANRSQATRESCSRETAPSGPFTTPNSRGDRRDSISRRWVPAWC
jgi:hypothetical protein